ncbi:MAG: class I SAM-dependent methyltransferase [Rhizobiaceae bacterium]|nr:class I SAM-dependent methyltransferase [Rhizobiaceae bacterium]
MMTSKKPIDSAARAMLKRAYSLTSDEETKTFYKDWAATYDDTMVGGLGYLTPQKAAILLASYLENKSDKILDVGTGTGLAGKELAALGYTDIDGMDYSAPMLAMARQRGVYSQLIEADLNKPLSLGDNTYDAITCVGTFTHGHVKSDCLDELFRILKSGGRFVTVIRKNYWQPAGFAAKVDELTQAGIMRTLSSEEDSNYVESDEAESWYIVWEKC